MSDSSPGALRDCQDIDGPESSLSSPDKSRNGDL